MTNIRKRTNVIIADFIGANEETPLWQELDQTSHDDLVDAVRSMAQFIAEQEEEIEQLKGGE